MSAVQRTSTATQAVVNASDKPSSTSDPPQRPPTTSAPRVRIEGVRGSNPLSSTRSCRSAATFGLPATCLSGGGCRRRADVSPRCLGYWPGPQVPIRGASSCAGPSIPKSRSAPIRGWISGSPTSSCQMAASAPTAAGRANSGYLRLGALPLPCRQRRSNRSP